MTESVYINTSVVSYLTARPARDVVAAARQIETMEWWMTHSPHFELFSSDTVVEEARRGHPEAAQRRIEILRELTMLTLTPEASDLTRAWIEGRAVPAEAEDDARHIAIATVDNIDYILTWNFAHIANTVTMPLVTDVCEQEGYDSPTITTPNQLRGGRYIGR